MHTSEELSVQLAETVSQFIEGTSGICPGLLEQLDGVPRVIPHELCVQIGVSSSEILGTIALHCDKKLVLKLSQQMLGNEDTLQSSEDVRDAIGEIANIIVGSFKSVLPCSVNEKILMTVPKVIDKDQQGLAWSAASGQWFAVCFDVCGEVLTIEVCLQPITSIYKNRAS